MKSVKILGLLILSSSSAVANFNTTEAGGRQIVRWTNVGPSNQEICVLPKHFEGAAYQQVMQADGMMSLVDEKMEVQLCGLDFHSETPSQFENLNLIPTAVCPKINSTNPGLEIFKIPEGLSKNQMESQGCKVEGTKKLAKYKMSTSCSYTPSILGYYHISRMLGNILHIPVSVLRTVDQNYHLALAKKGLQLTPVKDVIHQTFQTLVSGLEGHGSSSFNDRVLTTTHQSYGALLEVLKNESSYQEFYHPGNDLAATFKQKDRTFKMLSTDQTLEKIISKKLSKENLQSLVAMKDLSEMLIIDYLMNQKDRFGNIASIDFAYYKDDQGLLRRTAASNVSPNFLKPGVFVVKEMALKDNDCGGSDRTNVAKISGLTTGLRHLHPMTYHRLLWLNSIAQLLATKDFFTKEMRFTEQDQNVFHANLSELALKLRNLCLQGKLHLDLDFNQHFSGKENPMSKKCDLN